jgi:hypothetical protein
MNDEPVKAAVSATSDSAPCQMCGCAIPLDEAVVPEALPYVVNFCGLACYARWRAEATRAHLRVLPGGDDSGS